MDKLNKAIDTLKLQTTKKKDGPVSHKDKILLCQQMIEGIQNAIVKQSVDYGKVFSSSCETLFTLCDDAHADVRIVAEESLNSVIRNSLAEGNATRVHVELYKEIRRNGPARSLRSAFTKFAELSDQIRPQKCRMFAFNLVPCLTAVARRPEDSIYECFGAASAKIFASLGQFFSDEEAKILIKSILPNLQLTSAPARRGASSFLVDLCRYTRKKQFFTAYLLKSLLDTIVPVQLDQSPQQILGTLTALRSMTPLIKECDDNDVGEVRHVQTGAIRVNPQISLTLDQLLQLYEILLYYVCYPNNSVSTCALETLSAYLQNLPRRLIKILQSSDGVDKSRIYAVPLNAALGPKSRKSSFTGLSSGFSSIGGSQTDLSFSAGSLSIDNEVINLFPEISTSTENLFPPETSASPEEFFAKESDLFPIDNNNYAESSTLGDDDEDDDSENFFLDETKSKLEDGNILKYKNKRVLELGGLSNLTTEDEKLFSEPSTPLSPDGQGVFVTFPDDIGNFTHEENPLKYCCRLLCRKFLLSNEIGMLIADKDVRVSQKVLALNCVQSLCSLDPSLIGLSLTKNGGQNIKDIFLYSTHSDHLLRGETAYFVGDWLKCEFVSNRFRSTYDTQEVSTCDYLLIIINDMLSDQHFLAARSALLALKTCQNEILSWNDTISMKTALKLFDAALATLRHSYWTVKLALLEMWSNLNFCILRRCELQCDSLNAQKTRNSYQNQVLNAIVDDLLADENVRVRHEAASTLCSLVKSICFVDTWDPAKFVRSFEQQTRTSMEFFWYHSDFTKIHNLSPSFDQRSPKQLTSWQEENLSHVIALLYRALASSKDQFHLSGLANALSKLSEIYPPSQYFQSWSTFLTDYDTGAAHMSSLLQLLNTAIGTEAIALHQVLMILLGNLFAGYASRQLSKQSLAPTERWPLLANQLLGEFASELNLHCLRILSIYWHVCSETVPSAPPMITKPPMPQISHQSLPGGNVAQMIKSKLDGSKTLEKNEPATQPPPPPSQLVSKAKVGDYYNISHLLRLYEMVKGGWTNYKTSLDADVKERFVGLLRACLRCLSVILEIASLTDVEKISEEILLYVKPLMAVLPSEVVITVTQVLKSLFGTNLSLSVRPDSGAIAGVPSSTSYLSVMNVPSSLYQMCIVKPRTKFAQSMAAAAARHDLLSDPLNKHLGWFGSRADKHVVNLLKKPAHKTILTNYIRLFEPIVVQALRFYTSSVGVELQRCVINLLIQLVQIRVNYCLLDSDQKFLNFLFQQLENVEEGVLTNANELVDSLFEFFIILSYEKYQNKTVLEVPKILQLADALLASGLNKNLGISALHCVVVDLFLLRSTAKLESPKDLEIQQECVISVLMKSINCVQALDLFTFILYRTRRENEAKWRKLSRDIVDILLPFMSKGQFPFENIESFQTVVNFLDFLCPGAFRPVDAVLELFFSSPPTSCVDIERFCKWLSVEYVCFHAIVMHCREDAILSRLEVIPVTVQFDSKCCDSFRTSSPSPQSTPTQNSLPQDSVAQLLLSICDLSLNEFLYYRRSLPSTSVNFMERLILRYLQLTTHVCQSGAFRKIGASLSSRFAHKWTTDVTLLMKFSPQIVVQFFYLLSSVHVYDDRFWTKIISPDKDNNIILRQIVRILYADHVKAELMNGEMSTIGNKWTFDNIVELIDEPPVSELVGVLQRCHPASQVFLKVAENCLLEHKILPRRCVKMLKCLDSLHYNLSLDVLQLLFRCLESPYITVRQTASTMASRKIELILINRTSNDTSIKITEQQIHDIVRKLDSFKLKKFSHLRNLVLKLASSYSVKFTSTDENGVVDDDEICSALMKPSLKKPKFIQVLQCVVRRRCVDAKNISQILCAVNVDEASELLSDWSVKGDILEACILRDKIANANDDLGSPNGYPSEERSSVAVAACRALIAGIRTLFLKFPKDFSIDFDDKSFRFDPSLDVSIRQTRDRLFDYATAVRALLENNHLIKNLNEQDLQILTKFCCFLTAATLSLNSEISFIQALNAGECLISCFVCDRSYSTLCSNDFLKMQTILIGCVFWIVIKLYKFPDVLSTNVERPEIIGVDDNRMVFWIYVHSMLVWLERQRLQFNEFSNVLFCLAKKLIVGVARLPYVCSFSRVPMSIFKYGWVPNVKQGNGGNLVLPTIPVRYLQNVDSLHDFMFRVNLLGWTSRKDFEEIWMGLLGVLSATPIGQELQSNSAAEITNRVCASTVAVRCISSLLLQSLLYPMPGRPILSKFISKQREKQSTFLKTNSGQRLFELKRKISRPVGDFTNFHRRSSSYGRNVERLHNIFDYAVAQFSIDTLWSLTGILAEEESLVAAKPTSEANSKPQVNVDLAPVGGLPSSDDGKVIYLEEPPPGVIIKRSASNYILTSEGDLNLSSCFHFLLEELFGHWLANGSDAVPLPLLSATVEAVVLLSDLFHQRSQYEWLRDKLTSLHQQRTSEDELLMQDVALGLLKTAAVLGMNDSEKEKETLNFIDAGLNKRELSIRIATLQGAMYVLQTLTSDEIVGLMPILSEYILTHLTSYVVTDNEKLISDKPQCVDHQLILWAVGCFIVESFHDPHTKQSFAPKFLDVCIKALNNRNLPFVITKAVVSGVESLLINSSLDVKSLGQLAKLATDSIQQSDSSEISILSVELLLTCLYTAKENRRSDELTLPENETAPRNAGEPTLSAMERLSVLLTRITKGNRKEASVIGHILPSFLSDNFSPGDVMNKIITELLHPSQPHPEIIIKILHSLIESLLRQEATTVVCDWILLSMPSFTHKNPWQFAVWCLTCLLLSSSSNVFVKNLWSIAHCRLGQSEQLDVSLFCLAVENFCCQLQEKSQLESFLLTMNEASKRNPSSFYCRARDIVSNYCNLPSSMS